MKEKLSFTIDSRIVDQFRLFCNRYKFKSQSECLNKILITVLFDNKKKVLILEELRKSKVRSLQLLNSEILDLQDNLEEVLKC